MPGEKSSHPDPRLPVAPFQRLIDVVQDLSRARDVETITSIVRRAARELTGADGATFVLRDGDCCYYVDEDAISPLWKGKRFPMDACISGWVMLNARPAVIEDIYADPRIPAEAYRPTFVKSLAMVPIRRGQPIGAIGNYWATWRQPTSEEVVLLQALADTTSVALENANLYQELSDTIAMLRSRERRIEEQREALEVFTRALAHDLKEPIRTIRSFSSILGSDRAKPEHLLFIERAAERSALLIDSVFNYIQLDDPRDLERQTFGLGEAVDAASENLYRLITERGGRVTRDDLPTVTAHRPHMTQLFQSLISNAVQHGGSGTRVHVSTESANDAWHIRVADDGEGIPPEKRDKIFEPFRRLGHDDRHAGLGLAVGRRIVELHGGEIACESGLGTGASFRIVLPRTADDREPVQAAPMLSVATNGQSDLATIVLVDDLEPDVVLVQAELLEDAGLRCNFLVANDAEQALATFDEIRKRGDTVDLVLLDINMPGMNGFELMEQMRADPTMADIDIVMCTGSTYERDRRRARHMGAIGYLEKPIRFDRLRPILDQANKLQLKEVGGRPSLHRAAC